MSLIEATVTGSDRVVVRLQSLPDILRSALKNSLQRQLFRLQAAVVTGKLSGSPLHRRTGTLASSINQRLTDDGTNLVGQVGTKVRYGAVHETGGTFQIPEHTRTITQVFGRAVAPHQVSVRAHTATFPERSFLRSSLRDLRSSILDALNADVTSAAQKA